MWFTEHGLIGDASFTVADSDSVTALPNSILALVVWQFCNRQVIKVSARDFTKLGLPSCICFR